MQIMYPPRVIAAAAFYFARKFTGTEIPKEPDSKEWWEHYGVKVEHLRGISSLKERVDVDAVMMMVETYSALPQLRYQGKYPPSMVSPPETGKETPQQNGKEEPNGKPSSPIRSPVRSPVRKPSPSPRVGRTSRTLVDSYRPSSPNRASKRSRGSSRSRSRGPRPHTVDRYISLDLRRREKDSYIPRDADTYIPPRKRSIDDDSIHGREKRKRSEEVEEGEIR